MKIKELTEKEKAKFALRREADIYTSQRWWSRTFLSVTKETGVIGQLIIGSIILFIIGLSFQNDKTITYAYESTGFLIVGAIVFFPYFYIHKYSSLLNKILVALFYMYLIYDILSLQNII